MLYVCVFECVCACVKNEDSDHDVIGLMVVVRIR